ncbi:MAG: tetratricopeptide repeat protein [Phycisphaerae bacterium]|nr:tetratricopeptide repeat protein [Phycisphaerae bacterium]
MKDLPKAKEEDSGKGCLVMLLAAALGPWLLSLAATPLTGWVAEAIAWLNVRSPMSGQWSAYFALTALFLAGCLLLSPLRLTNLEGGRLLSEPYILAAGVDMLLVFVVANAAMHAAAGWSAEDISLFYSSSGVPGKLFTAPFVLVVQMVVCTGAAWVGWFCFLKLSGISVPDQAPILKNSPQEPWRDHLIRHADEGRGCSPLVVDVMVYVPALVTLAIVHRSNPFVLTSLVCLMIARAVVNVPSEFVSAWLDWRSDRLARRLCAELVDPPRARSRLDAVKQLAEMRIGILSGQEQVASVLEDADPEVRQAAAAVMEKIKEAKLRQSKSIVKAAKELREKGSHEQAIKLCDRALELAPENALAYYSRARVHDKTSQYDIAIADYTEALRLNPDNANYYNGRGLSYFKSDQFNLAIADYNEAIRLNPKDPSAYGRRSEALAATGDYEKAWADVKACRKCGGQPDSDHLARLRKDSKPDE